MFVCESKAVLNSESRELSSSKCKPCTTILQSRVVHGELLKMNSENTAALERHFEGWLSVILGWGNWKVLGGFP